MKTLILIRHAKSSWKDPGKKDFDRPLNTRGVRDLDFLSQKIAKTEGTYDLLIASPAKRTWTTAKGFAKAFGNHQDPEPEKDIYAASLSQLRHILENLPDSANKVLLVGHNPGISLLCNYLLDDNLFMPTCGIMKIRLDIDSWKLCSLGSGTMDYFEYPKKYFPAED